MKKVLILMISAGLAFTAMSLPPPPGGKGVQAVLMEGWDGPSVSRLATVLTNGVGHIAVSEAPFLLDEHSHLLNLSNLVATVAPHRTLTVIIHLGFHGETDYPTHFAHRATVVSNFVRLELVKPYGHKL